MAKKRKTSTAPKEQIVGLGWFAGDEPLTPEAREEKLKAIEKWIAETGLQAPATDTNSDQGAHTQRRDTTKAGGDAVIEWDDSQQMTVTRITPAQETTVGDKPAEDQPASPNAPQTPVKLKENGEGDVSFQPAGGAVAVNDCLTREESQAEASRRWRREGIAEQVAVYRDRMREEYRENYPKCRKRDAHEYAWRCALAEFPPPGMDSPEEPKVSSIEEIPEPETSAIADKSEPDQGVPGLGDMPDSWGELPANASLQAEISWVTANRLRVRDGTGVDLSRALSPAPSYSALSWLETSILFPSKFADISVKATQNQEDEKEHVRREKMAIDEIRGMLAEMLEE